ncbi:hypothetical protein RRG08_053183 [Elysia crispata]|uniref:Uncharacterized protein n=1 Tax=Elysia crispata TaxID=231223 RepID=A0AAE0YR11_9GAST|nr:hypothetical protein RRG08_053183 [Elysia crispata]
MNPYRHCVSPRSKRRQNDRVSNNKQHQNKTILNSGKFRAPSHPGRLRNERDVTLEASKLFSFTTARGPAISGQILVFHSHCLQYIPVSRQVRQVNEDSQLNRQPDGVS